jgi:DNA-3-methyladenine glycosylase II
LTIIGKQWQPYRTVASMMLWHYYLSAPKPTSKKQ